MNKIETYQDLLNWKKELEGNLATLRVHIHSDVVQLKDEWKPVTNLLSGLGRTSAKSKIHPLVSLGMDLVGQVLVQNSIPKVGGWIAKSILPILSRSFSKHVLNKNGTSGIRQWLSRFRNHEPSDRPVIGND